MIKVYLLRFTWKSVLYDRKNTLSCLCKGPQTSGHCLNICKVAMDWQMDLEAQQQCDLCPSWIHHKHCEHKRGKHIEE